MKNQTIKNQTFIREALKLIVDKEGMELLERLTGLFSEVWSADSVFIGALKDELNDLVMGLVGYKFQKPRPPFEYCSTDQPCQLVYKGQKLNIPCGVQRQFKRKEGSGHESFLGLPITHPDEGVIAHFAAYDSRENQFAEISQESLALLELIISREMALILAREKEKAIDSVTTELNQWRSAALTDPLTGLHNRRALEEDWAEYVKTAGDAPPAVSILDIDYFKKLNDNYGHDTGDACLKYFAEQMQSYLDNQKVGLYRLGGEEFCCVAFDEEQSQLAEQIEAFKQHLAETIKQDEALPDFSFSAGVAHCEPTADLYDSLKSSDELLYQAKAAGRDQVMTDEILNPSNP